ncbi:MAG: FAD-linked oxidase C-terminal domain-containing protein [Gammaproteobacteria bacterium]
MDDRIIVALRSAMPAGTLRTDSASRVAAGYDNSRRQVLPDAVAVPANADEVAAVVRVCHDHRTPVVARGLGTATTGAAVPVKRGIVLSFERMDRIIALDPANRTIIVEPGVLNSEVQRAAGEAGFFWAPDPTSARYSTVGGNLACNAGGPRAVKYGTVRENVLGLRAVTGTGESIRTGTSTTKGVVGYDLTRLLLGSEGTLALITEATLKLTPLQPARATLRAEYRDAVSAARAVARIMAGGITPCTLEFMDGTAIELVRAFDDVGVSEKAGALLLVECDGDARTAAADLAIVCALADTDGVLDLNVAQDNAAIESLWRCRRALSPAQRKLKPHKINEDVAVPVSRLPRLVGGIAELGRKHRVLIVSFGHAGNGNLHVNLLGDPAAGDELARMHACLDDLFALVLSLEGTLSGEHGIGYDKREFLALEIAPPALILMQAIKRQFDPHCILNPGKVFPDAGH